MTKPTVELVPGTLDMLILKAVAREVMHGFGVARWIERVTDDRLTVDEGALYPALHRLEKRGWLEADWRMTENKRRAKYYGLTKAGRAELTSQIDKWEGSTWAIEKVLGG
ncbi:MAG: PadR family transcriptional regulator [Gemmatimonadetes bacterium]|nr:PadR family transcriptional regulator [Gemmatimonadota bacterium]